MISSHGFKRALENSSCLEIINLKITKQWQALQFFPEVFLSFSFMLLHTVFLLDILLPLTGTLSHLFSLNDCLGNFSSPLNAFLTLQYPLKILLQGLKKKVIILLSAISLYLTLFIKVLYPHDYMTTHATAVFLFLDRGMDLLSPGVFLVEKILYHANCYSYVTQKQSIFCYIIYRLIFLVTMGKNWRFKCLHSVVCKKQTNRK